MIFLSLLCLSLQAGPRVAAAPMVLVVRTEASPDAARREQKLYEQLSIALDDFAVMLTAPPEPGFADLKLPEQVAIALSEAESTSAVAVAWLVLPAPKQVMVHLVARGTGRTLIKTVEATTGPQAESTLAVVVRELLGTAFLFEPSPELPTSLQSVVREVRAQVTPTAPTPPPPAPLAWRAQVVSSTRTVSQQGASLSLGALFSRRLLGTERWSLSGVAQLDLGPVDARPALFILEGSLGVDVFYSFTTGAQVGPFADLQAGARFIERWSTRRPSQAARPRFVATWAFARCCPSRRASRWASRSRWERGPFHSG